MRHGRFWLALVADRVSGWAVWSAAQPPKKPPPADRRPRSRPPTRRAKRPSPSGSARCSKRTRAAAPPSTGSTATTSSAAPSTSSIGEYADRTKKDAKDGVAWMIVGLLESQRGKDAAAVAAFQQGRGEPARQRHPGVLPRPVARPRRPAGRGRRGVRAGHRPQAEPQRPARHLPGPRPRLPARPADRARPSTSGTGWRSSSPTTPACRSRSPRRSSKKGSSTRPCRGCEKLADADRGQVPPVDVPHGRRRAEGEAQEDARGARRLREAARRAEPRQLAATATCAGGSRTCSCATTTSPGWPSTTRSGWRRTRPTWTRSPGWPRTSPPQGRAPEARDVARKGHRRRPEQPRRCGRR